MDDGDLAEVRPTFWGQLKKSGCFGPSLAWGSRQKEAWGLRPPNPWSFLPTMSFVEASPSTPVSRPDSLWHLRKVIPEGAPGEGCGASLRPAWAQSPCLLCLQLAQRPGSSPSAFTKESKNSQNQRRPAAARLAGRLVGKHHGGAQGGQGEVRGVRGTLS